MPITKSAKKTHRASLRKRVFNVRRKKAMNDVLKKTQKLLKSGKQTEAGTLLPEAYKVIDKAAKRGLIKKNTAARRKSRLAKVIQKISK